MLWEPHGRRRLRHALGIALLATALLNLPAAAQAAPQPARPVDGVSCAPVLVAVAPDTKVQEATAGAAMVQTQPNVTGLGDDAGPMNASSTFDVRYHNFPPAMQAAFQAAVDTWAGLISSPVPITVDATWGPTGGPGIATASPTMDLVPGHDVWYPQALADRLTGQTLDPGAPDVSIEIDSAPLGDPARW